MTAKKRKTAKMAPIENLNQILTRLKKAHPDAKLDLDFSNTLELLIALILAAQARDDLVNQVTPELFKANCIAADYAKLPLAELEKQIGKINFYRNKAKSIHNCCAQLVERFNGQVPDTLENLVSLPGVGRKTANIVLGNGFGQQTIGVDTHVMRLSQRLGFSNKTDPDKIEADLTAIVPAKQRVRFCHLMQYHGRRVCFAKKPKCTECPIEDLCPFPGKSKA
jgi:endonuclease III